MSTIEIILRIVAGGALVLINAFFVAIEFSLTRLRQFPGEDFEDHASLRRAWSMTDELEIYLTGCQLGISLSSILLGVVAEPAVTAVLEPLFTRVGLSGASASGVSIVVAIVLIQLVHKIWGEQTPTYLGVERPKFVARWLAPVLYWWSKGMYPLIILGDSLAKWTLRLFGVEMTRSWVEAEQNDDSVSVRERLMRLLGEARIKGERREEIVNAYELGEHTVGDIMVPRDEIVALRAGEPVDRNLARIRKHGLTRLPLTGEELSDYRGVVYVAALISEVEALKDGSVSFADVAGDPVTITREVHLDEAIDLLQDSRSELALVSHDDEVVGLITATDIFEAIIGELEDPLDAPA